MCRSVLCLCEGCKVEVCFLLHGNMVIPVSSVKTTLLFPH